nr:MAG TPA: hypothetical protein [Caudoviricetes sp.]
MAGQDRWPKLRSENSPGFETDGKDGFEHKIRIVIDYSNADSTVREVEKIFSDFSYDLKTIFKSIDIPTGKTDNLFYVNPGPMLNYDISRDGVLDELIRVVPDGERTRAALRSGVQQIGADGKATMQKYVNRIETGRMKESIKYATRGDKKKYIIDIGWTELWYKYFGFQEMGFKNVPPMRSLMRTYAELLPRTQKYLSRFMRTYTKKEGKGVDYK